MGSIFIQKSDELLDTLSPWLNTTTVLRLSRVNSAFRNWASENGRDLHLKATYVNHPCVNKPTPFLLGSTSDFPSHGRNSRGEHLFIKDRKLLLRLSMSSLYYKNCTTSGGDLDVLTEESVPWGTALNKKKSTLTATLVFDNAEKGAVPLRCRQDHQDFSEDFASKDGVLPPLQLFTINRLSSHFTPETMFRVRLTASVCLLQHECDHDTDEFTHYTTYTPPFWVVSRIQTEKSIATQKERRAKKRGFSASVPAV